MSDAKTDLETRKASAASIRAKHPDRIPVIVDKRGGDTSLPDIDKVPQLLSTESQCCTGQSQATTRVG